MTGFNKRHDIQWLRALAIIAVLSFHFWPNVFHYGYIGVDIFFVISGYLMTSILAKSTNQNIRLFYSRRIKRIFPTCLLVITLVMVIGYIFLLNSDYEFLQIEALWSIFFINNLSTMFNQQPYFELVSEFKFLLHTWSLGVEIQFYLIAPFLIKFILSRNNQIIYAALIAIASFLLQIFVTNEPIAFGLVFCRIWQFLIGTLAFCTIQKHSKLVSSLCNSYTTTVILLALIFNILMPQSLSHFYIVSILLRLSATLLTGIFILLYSSYAVSLPLVIDNWLTYIGDSSYVIYLIHWPLIIYFKYFPISSYYGTSFTLICTIMSSVIIHEAFEKQMNKKPLSFNLFFCTFCYCVIFYLCFTTKQHNSNAHDIIKLNEDEAKICSAFQLPYCKKDPIIEKYLTNRPKKNKLDVYCSYKLDSTSNKTIMITGNSFVYFQALGIAEALKKTKTKFSKAYYVAHPGCSLLVGEFNKLVTIRNCENFDGSHDELLNALKPDVIVHTARFDHIKGFEKYASGNITNDKIYKAIEKSISHLSNFTKRLIIVQPTPHVYGGYKSPLSVAHMLMKNQSLTKYDTPFTQYKKDIYPAWNRIKEATKLCSNCILMNVEKLFCTNTSCPVVDPKTKIGLYCDVSHTSHTMSYKLTKSLIEAIDS